MSDNLNIKLGGDVSRLTTSLGKATKALESTAKAGRSAGGDFRNFQKETRRLNDAFSNLNRDGNRTTKTFKGLGSSALSLGNIFKGLMAHKVGNYLQQATKSAMDLIETNALFTVSMGELTEETDNAISKISELTGMDIGNLRDRIGTINMLGLTMGFTAKNAQTLGFGVNQLSLDMGALFNVPYQQMLEDLRSGLIGQSRTLYKYGIDVTEAAIANEALAQGISKSVRHMTQGEKMMLRYSVITKQAGLMQGQFANQFNQPINQLRVLTERFVTLSRTIGKLFVPVMSVIIKYANAVVIALTRVFNALGKLLGIDMESKVSNPADSFGGIKDDIDDGMDNLNGGLDKASKKAKKLKKQLAGFDELNIINTKEPEVAGGTGGAGGLGGMGGGSPFDFDLELYESLFDKIEDKAKNLSDDIVKWLKNIWDVAEPTRVALKRLWDEGLSELGNFSMGVLSDFYTSFLVPVGNWVLGEGLPRLLDILNDFLLKIDWDGLRTSFNKLWTALSPFAMEIGIGLLNFYENVLSPLGVWVVNEMITPFIEKLADKIENLTKWMKENPDVVEKFLKGLLMFKGLKGIFGLVKSLIGGIFSQFAPLEPILGYISGLLSKIGLIKFGALVGGIAIVIGSIVKAKDYLENMMDKYPKLKELFELMGGSLSFLWDSIKKLMGNLWELVKEVFDVVTSIGGGILTLLAPILAMVVTLVSGAIGVIINIINGIVTVIRIILKVITGDWSGAWDLMKDLFSKTIGKVIDFFKDFGKSVFDKIKEIKDNIVSAFSNAGSWAKERFNAVTDVFKNIGKWFLEKFTGAMDSIKSAFSTIGEWAKGRWDSIKNVFSAVGTWFGDKFTNAWTSIKNAFSGAKTWASDTWTSIKDIFKKVPDWFKTQFTNAWTNVKNVFSTGGKIFTGIKDGIASTFRTIVNGIIDGINRVIRVPFNAINGMLNTIRNVGVLGIKPFSGLWKHNPLSIPAIPRLADGGILDMGQLFIAREAGAELVGNFGNKTGVVNNDDIIESMTRSVTAGVYEAMKSAGGDGEPHQIIINVGGRTLVDEVIKGSNRQSVITGKSVFNI